MPLKKERLKWKVWGGSGKGGVTEKSECQVVFWEPQVEEQWRPVWDAEQVQGLGGKLRTFVPGSLKEVKFT